jgi:hypothetical protein
MRLRIAALAAVMAIGALAACGGDDVVLTGKWRGQLTQKGLPPFTVAASIRDLEDAAANTVHYSGIDCGGNWTYLGRDDGAYRFREVIDRGAGGACKGVGVVTLTPAAGGRLGYEFRGGGVESTGLLSRVR